MSDSLHEAAKYWRGKLIQGKPIQRVRVRRLLELAGAKRRGSAISTEIRMTLEQYQLSTEPDFQSVWPDSQVTIVLGPEVDLSREDSVITIPVDDHARDSVQVDPAIEVENPANSSNQKGETLDSPDNATGLIEVPAQRTADPVARVSSIPSSKMGIVSVLLSDSLETATTRMTFYGYSQLAIMQNDREVRGMISWESIAKRSMKAPLSKDVSDCRIDAQVVEAESSLYDALPAIAKHGYVLVRSPEKKITGIVSASDLATEFGQLSYAFMSLRTIEVMLRGKLHPCLHADDLNTLEEHSRARKEGDPTRLTFGENVRLLQRDDIWTRLNVRVYKPEVIGRLLEIQEIRNYVMHFDPQPLTEEKKGKLLQMEGFLKQAFV